MDIRCSSCGTENRGGARFCLRCGSRLGVPADADPLIGRLLLGRYRVQRAVGEGGMGRVYLAEQQMGTAARRVAIKVLHDKLSRDERVRQRFHRECAIVIQLSHPHTIQFHDFGELEDGRLFIVMEYIEGHSLADEIAEGPIPAPRAERILAQIAGSLQDAHRQGVIHRDLKPDNILLTERGGETDFVKVCDFGIAKVATEGGPEPGITLEGTIIGTPQYMSPEQLSGGEISPRSDVYSLGLIAFEMLTGERPFTANSPLEWAARHTTAEPPSLDAYPATRAGPPRHRVAVARALRKLPAERQPGARAFAQELLGTAHATTPPTMAMPSRPPEAAVAPTVLDHSVTGPPPPRLPPARSRSLVLPLLLLAGSAMLAVAGVTIFLNRDRLPWRAEVTATARDAGFPDAGAPDAGRPALEPHGWLRIVQLTRAVGAPANALGPPDQRYAVIRPQGTIVLEMRAGRRIATDGTPGPDLWIEIDDERSGPYRADVGVARHQYTTIGSDIVGSLELDVDQFDITRVRYVRVKNRSTRNVYLDAVGAYSLVPAGE